MGVSVRFHRRRHSEFPLDQSPATMTQKGSPLMGGFLIAFATVWGGFPLMALLSGELEGLESLLVLIFPTLGIGLALWGLHMILWRKEITIDRYFVSVEESGLRGRKSWQENLDSYQGVLRRSRRVKTKNSSYTLYLIELLHGEKDKTINLFQTTSDRGWRQKWETYAQHFRKPALEEGEDGLIARDAEDLDKSVGELLQEGKVKVDYNALTEKAEGLAVDFEGETIVITRTGPKNHWFGSLLAVLFPLVFVYFGFFHDDSEPFLYIFGVVGLLFEFLFLFAVIWDQLYRHRLRVSPSEIRLNDVGPRSETKGKTLPIGQVENLRIGRKDGRGTAALLIEGDRGRLKFGSRLPKASLEFVQNTILAKIDKHQPR